MKNLGLITYTIGELTEDLRALREFRDPYDYLKDSTSEWWREFTSNPSAQASDLAIILAIDGDAVVGRLGLWAAEVAVGGVKTRTYWLTYFVLHEDYRDTGAGGMMLLKAISHSRCLVAAGGVPSNVQKLYKAAGFKELGPLRRYVYFYSPEVIFRKFLRLRWLATLLSVVAAGPLSFYYRLKRKGLKSDLEFRPVTSFRDDLDNLPRHGNYFPRTSARLNWVLAVRKNVYGFEVFRVGQLSGYCLLRTMLAEAQSEPRSLPEMRVGSLLDFYIEGAMHGDKMALIDFSIAFFKPKKMDILECQTNDEELIGICSRLGLLHVGGFRVLLRPPRKAPALDEEPWYLTQAEGDVLLG